MFPLAIPVEISGISRHADISELLAEVSGFPKSSAFSSAMSSSSVPEVLLRRGLWPLLTHLACGRCNASLRRGLWPLLAHLACRRCHGAPDSNDANLNGKFCACGESWSRRCPPWSSQTWRLLAPAGRHTRDLAAPHTRDTAARACMLRIALDATRRNSMRRAPRTFSCMDAGTVALGTTTGSRTLLLEPWSLEHAAQGSSCDSPK